MEDKNPLTKNIHWELIAAGLILIFIMLLPNTGIYARTYFIGPLTLRHWMSIIGTSFIAIGLPLYALLKRRKPHLRKNLLYVHVYVGLFSFLLISTHFISHFIPGINIDIIIQTGVGYLLYTVVALLAVTGIFKRYRMAKRQVKIWNFLHPSLAVSFYLVTVFHTVRALIE